MHRFGWVLVSSAALALAEKPDSSIADTTVAATPSPPLKYQALKGESKITYLIRHPLHEVEGVSKLFDCTVELGADTLQAKIKVKAPVAAFNSGNSNRDSHTLELLDAFKFPFVEFVSDSIRRDSGDYRVFGQLQFHGVKKPVSFPVEWWDKDGKIHVAAEFKVRLSDHKVKRPTLMMVPTEDWLRIRIHAVALRHPPVQLP